MFSANADDRIDRGHPVVVISFRYWVDRLGHRPDIVGKKILVNGHPMEVVGVASAGFNGMDPAQAPHIWLPLRMKALMTPEEDGLNDPHYDFVQVFARLKAGYTVESARASLQPLFHQLLEDEVTDAQIGRQSAYDRDLFLKRRVLVERAATGYSEMRQQVLHGAAGTDGDGRPDPSHRLLECGEPAHRARRRAADARCPCVWRSARVEGP